MKKLLFILFISALLAGCVAKPERKVESIFYPPLPQQPRLQFLHTIKTEEDIGGKKGGFTEFLVGKEPAKKQIARAYVISAVKGKIYLSDRTHKKILILDLANKKFDYIKDEREGAISDPAGIWITDDETKYIADMGRKQILTFDKNDKFVRAYGEEGQFDRPTDVAVYKNKIYVTDINRHHVLVLDKKTGETIQTIGGPGTGEGQFNRPSHLIVDDEGNLYVNDSFNFRIQKFDPEGKFLKAFGHAGDSLGAFARPKGLAVDKEGHLYVIDTAFENVQVFDDKTTDLLLFFGGSGTGPGKMYLPNGIFIDYQNVKYFQKYVDRDYRVKYLVYVANMLGDNKLNVYGFGNWIGKPLPKMERKTSAQNGEEKKAR